MPNITILTTTFPPEMGAASYRIFDLAVALKKAKHSVEVYTAIPNYPTKAYIKPYPNLFFYKEYQEGISVRRHGLYPSHSRRASLRLLTMMSLCLSVALFSSYSLLKKKRHILFVQTPPPALSVFAVLIKKITRAKLIVNISDLWPSAMQDLEVIQKGKLFGLLTHLQNYIYRQADLCSVQSQEIWDFIKPKNANLFLLRSGVDFRKYENTKRTFRNPKLQVVYFGVAGLAHGLYDICKAIDFRNIKIDLHLFCEGLERNKIEQLRIRKSHIHENFIHLHEIVNRNALIKKLVCYDFALISQKTAIYGTVPSKIYEAAAMGLPIIFIGSGEGKEIVEKYQLGFTAFPKDVKGLNKILQHCQGLSTIQKLRMSQQNQNVAAQYFDKMRSLREFANNLQDMIGNVK